MEKMALESWKKVNLSPSHAYLLLLVIEKPGIQPMELSEELQLATLYHHTFDGEAGAEKINSKDF